MLHSLVIIHSHANLFAMKCWQSKAQTSKFSYTSRRNVKYCRLLTLRRLAILCSIRSHTLDCCAKLELQLVPMGLHASKNLLSFACCRSWNSSSSRVQLIAVFMAHLMMSGTSTNILSAEDAAAESAFKFVVDLMARCVRRQEETKEEKAPPPAPKRAPNPFGGPAATSGMNTSTSV